LRDEVAEAIDGNEVWFREEEVNGHDGDVRGEGFVADRGDDEIKFFGFLFSIGLVVISWVD